jgi:AraC-like DNA-binding protein
VFTGAKVHHLIFSRSDHCPVLIETRHDAWEKREKRLFRYELMWERYESLVAEVRKLWCSSGDRGNLGNIINTLSSMQGALHRWSKNHFGEVTEEINKLSKELDAAKSRNPTNRVEIRRIADRMDELLYCEEMIWLQHSRISWLREGDRNTRYFHMQEKWHAGKNKIKKLKCGDGSWCDALDEMKSMSRDYFADLFTADLGVCPNQILNHVVPKINDEMNEGLCKELPEKEIADAMFQMRPLKAPGLDGFPACFYQRHWDTMSKDVVAMTQQLFSDGVLLEGINDTAIVLIPKGNNLEELKEFRPISLCNIIYKLISKCIVNRLRVLLDDVISPEQSAFVPTRWIIDNALIAFECVHEIQKNNSRRGDFCAYKLDLSKAYGHVD